MGTTTAAPAPSPPPPPTPTPPVPPAPAPTPPAPTPVPSIHGIRNALHVCLQAEHETPAHGDMVSVDWCDGSERQDWNFDFDKSAITYKDLCMDATDMATGTSLILWDCNGQDQQHWDVQSKEGWAALTLKGDKCLDVWMSDDTNNKGLWIWDCNQQKNQH